MRVESPRLPFHTGPDALLLDDPRELDDLRFTRAQADPHHSCQATAFERADLAQPEAKPPQLDCLETPDDAFRQRELDVAEKAQGQVEV